MAIADIQITPPVLNLDPVTRKGQFRVQIANQLGRDGRMQVSLIPTGDTKPDWLQVDDKFRQLALKKDETAVFDVAVAVPAAARPGTYGFRLRCADDLDPANVKDDSEQRDFVVVAAASKPTPPSWRKWALIAGAGAVLVGGGIALAVALTGGDKPCQPACATGSVCDNGTCKPAPPPAHDAGGSSRPGACVEGANVSPCGQCQGVLRCDGSCSKPTPTNLGRSCNACGGKYDCQGGCWPVQRPNFGQTCNACGGKYDCQGNCTPPQPPDLGQVTVKYSLSWLANTASSSLGGRCDLGHVFKDATVRSNGAFPACSIVSRGSGNNCTVVVAKAATPLLIPVECEVVIWQQRVCN